MAVLEQERHVELVSGAAEAFFVTNRMVSANIPVELPHLSVFVVSVADPTDPTQDSLTRVAMLADLSLIPIGRDPGIAAPGPNGIEYLSDSSTNTYADLETANDAATAFQDRVNALIEDWITFRTDFNAPDPTPAMYTLPRVDASQLQALINAYAAAKQAGYTQLQTTNAASATFTAAQADYTYKQNLVAGVGVLVADTTKVKNEFGTTVTQFGTLNAAGNTFYNQALATPPSDAQRAVFLSALTTATSQQTAMAGYLTDAQMAVTDTTAYQVARQNDANTSVLALTAATSNNTTQAQLLISANTLTAAALAAVTAVCPDFDSTTIPYVPG